MVFFRICVSEFFIKELCKLPVWWICILDIFLETYLHLLQHSTQYTKLISSTHFPISNMHGIKSKRQAQAFLSSASLLSKHVCFWIRFSVEKLTAILLSLLSNYFNAWWLSACRCVASRPLKLPKSLYRQRYLFLYQIFILFQQQYILCVVVKTQSAVHVIELHHICWIQNPTYVKMSRFISIGVTCRKMSDQKLKYYLQCNLCLFPLIRSSANRTYSKLITEWYKWNDDMHQNWHFSITALLISGKNCSQKKYHVSDTNVPNISVLSTQKRYWICPSFCQGKGWSSMESLSLRSWTNCQLPFDVLLVAPSLPCLKN